MDDKPGTLEFSAPKNASRRTVDLPQRTLDALRTHRKRQLEGRVVPAGLVFATGLGTLLDAQNVVNQRFKPLLLSRGTHPTYVQKSLGHASVQLTLDRYSHWMPSMGRNTAQGIDEAIG